jgi:hypothetical protein
MNPALIAKLTVHGLTRSAQSRDLTETLAHREGMSLDSVAVSQKLLPMDALKLAGIHSVAELFTTCGTLSKFHRDNTLPWDNEGGRILPAVHYDKYQTAIGKLIERLHLLRDTVADQWDTQILPVCRAAHSHRFKPELYPTRIGILQKVDATIAYSPLSTDFRTDILGEAVAAQLSAQAADRLSAAVSTSNKQIAAALLDMLQKVVDIMANPKGKLYDSLFSNLREFLDRMPALNLNNDPTIADLRQAVGAKIARYSMETVRQFPAMRGSLASTATSTIATYARKLQIPMPTSAQAPAQDLAAA